MRLGDYVDDYCSRCKRTTDHAVGQTGYLRRMAPWPACALHALRALLLARPAHEGVLAAKAARANEH